jgi:exopolysaccharide biosynthesis polyprenyl glycosylphosphotransferase
MQENSISSFAAKNASVPRRTRRLRMRATLVGLDAVALLTAGMVASQIRFGSVFSAVAFENTTLHVQFWQVAFIIVPMWLLLLASAGLYDIDQHMLTLGETGRIARALSMGVVAIVLIAYLAKTPGLSRAWTLLAWVLAIFIVVSARSAFALVRTIVRRRGHMLQPVIIVGSNAEASDLIRIIGANRESGLVPVGCLTASMAERLELDYCSDDIPVLGSAREIKQVLEDTGVDTVVIASSAFDHDVLARMIAELRDGDIDVHISSGLFEVLTNRVLVSEIAGIPLITVRGISLSTANLLTKRAFDLTLSILALVIGSPIWLAIALAVKLTSRGPIFYGQTRIGRHGRQFRMLKFRSMYVDAEERLAELKSDNEASGPLFKMKNDPRVTPVGRWMRKFSIDEFPQLINVLRGEMSLVGPRPPLPEEVTRYTSQDWRRLEVVPGMTGLWQVSGRSSLTFDEMVRLDIFYIENWSVSLDMTLIMRTIPAVLLAKGAY